MSKKLDFDLLVSVFSDGCKKKNNWSIGTEHEKFGFIDQSLEPINFNNIEKIFNLLSENYSWEKVLEDNKVISLKKNGSSITLEPGGQLELSGAPLKNLFETCKEVNTHKDELNEVCKSLGISFMGMGVLPKWDLSKIEIMPKKRYKIMSKYMPKVGEHGLDMMMRTTTIQANFDFSSEEDMKKKMRVAQSIQPCVVALYANSPFINGRLTKFQSFRSYIWTKTDPDRTGLLKFIYENDFSFEKYVDYLLDIPMYFIIRDKKYINCTDKTFREFINNEESNFIANLDDWKNHLTTVFPEVRLKSYIEVRGADGGPWSRVCALPAFWTGILYDEDILNTTWEQVKHWKFSDIENFYINVRTNGLNSLTPDGESLNKFIEKMLKYSKMGLNNRNIFRNEHNESIFLNPLVEIMKSGNSPAKYWEEKFVNDWSENIDNIYKANFF